MSEISEWHHSGPCHCSICRLPHADEVPPPPAKAPRPSWDDYFMEIARLVRTRATCPRAAVGCVVVDRQHRIVGTGYNGAPAGVPHCTDVGCTVFADHCVRAVHAEANAVARIGEGVALPLTAYVVGPRTVCSHCARLLWDEGVCAVIWRES